MISVHFQGIPCNITVIQDYAPTSNAEETEVEWFHKELQDLLEITHKKRCPFHFRGMECKSRKSRNTWSNSKFGLGVQNEAGQRQIEFCQENTLVIVNTFFQQHKGRLYIWTSQVVNTKIRLIIFFVAKDGEALFSQQKQDQELTVAQIMNSLLPNSDLN